MTSADKHSDKLESTIRLFNCLASTIDNLNFDDETDNDLEDLAEDESWSFKRGLPISIADSALTKLSSTMESEPVGSLPELHNRWLELIKQETNFCYDNAVNNASMLGNFSNNNTTVASAASSLAFSVEQSLQKSGAIPAFLSSVQSDRVNDDSLSALASGQVEVRMETSSAIAQFCPGDPFSVVNIRVREDGSSGAASFQVKDVAQLRERSRAAARAKAMEDEVLKLRSAFPIDWDREAGRLKYMAGRRGMDIVELDIGSERAIRVVSVQPGGCLPPGCILPPSDAPLDLWLKYLECEFFGPPPESQLSSRQSLAHNSGHNSNDNGAYAAQRPKLIKASFFFLNFSSFCRLLRDINFYRASFRHCFAIADIVPEKPKQEWLDRSHCTLKWKCEVLYNEKYYEAYIVQVIMEDCLEASSFSYARELIRKKKRLADVLEKVQPRVFTREDWRRARSRYQIRPQTRMISFKAIRSLMLNLLPRRIRRFRKALHCRHFHRHLLLLETQRPQQRLRQRKRSKPLKVRPPQPQLRRL
uniref:START domain-containing protein n=1 Tax=Macrostomum lignano TaxID=282301 RepID=A0A1I8HA37_9PLAT